MNFLELPGALDPMLRDMSQCGRDRQDSHACQNLLNLLHKKGHSIPVPLAAVTTPVRWAKRGSSKKAMIQYPILKLSDWCAKIFQAGGNFLLGGLNLDSAEQFGETLQLFWHRFRVMEPNLPFYQREDHDWRYCLPFALHGDEGRSLGKRPVMIIAAQPLIACPDMSESNLKGYPA